MEKITQKLDKPVLFPRIFGPKKLPSNCCRIKTNIAKYNACFGFTIKIRTILGIAPRYGPKNGIIFVIPTITLIRSGYGNCNNVIPMKHIKPMIRESTSLPLIKPPNVALTNRILEISLLAVSSSQIAYMIFLDCPAKLSLLTSRYTEMISPISRFHAVTSNPSILEKILLENRVNITLSCGTSLLFR